MTDSALTPKQEKLDLNDNGKIDAEDLKELREGDTKASVRAILARLTETEGPLGRG